MDITKHFHQLQTSSVLLIEESTRHLAPNLCFRATLYAFSSTMVHHTINGLHTVVSTAHIGKKPWMIVAPRSSRKLAKATDRHPKTKIPMHSGSHFRSPYRPISALQIVKRSREINIFVTSGSSHVWSSHRTRRSTMDKNGPKIEKKIQLLAAIHRLQQQQPDRVVFLISTTYSFLESAVDSCA